jgi:hypothetical protein
MVEGRAAGARGCRRCWICCSGRLFSCSSRGEMGSRPSFLVRLGSCKRIEEVFGGLSILLVAESELIIVAILLISLIKTDPELIF